MIDDTHLGALLRSAMPPVTRSAPSRDLWPRVAAARSAARPGRGSTSDWRLRWPLPDSRGRTCCCCWPITSEEDSCDRTRICAPIWPASSSPPCSCWSWPAVDAYQKYYFEVSNQFVIPLASRPLERALLFPMAVVPNAWGLWNMLYLRLRPRVGSHSGLFGALLVLAAHSRRHCAGRRLRHVHHAVAVRPADVPGRDGGVLPGLEIRREVR